MKHAKTEPNQNGKELSQARFKAKERQECKQCLSNVTDMNAGARMLKATPNSPEYISGCTDWNLMCMWFEGDCEWGEVARKSSD